MANDADQTNAHADRRKFLKACGEFAAVTPPAITVLLSTSLTSRALAYSAGAERVGPVAHPGPSHSRHVPREHPRHPERHDSPRSRDSD
jgi:hypothetical protein